MRIEARVSSGCGVSHCWRIVPAVGVDIVAMSDSVEALVRTVEDFGSLMAAGGFSVEDRVHGCTSCELVWMDRGVDGLSWTFVLHGCDVRYVRVLVNELHATSETVLRLQSVHVSEDPEVSVELDCGVDGAWVADRDFYQPLPHGLPSVYVTGECDRADRHRRVLIELACAIDDRVERWLASRVLLWRRFAAFGYPSSQEALASGAYGVSGVDHGVFDEYTYEVYAAEFMAAEAAWVPLMNMLGAGCDQDGLPLERITIE